MTTMDIPTQTHTSVVERVRISVEPNNVLQTSPEILAEEENKFCTSCLCLLKRNREVCLVISSECTFCYNFDTLISCFALKRFIDTC